MRLVVDFGNSFWKWLHVRPRQAWAAGATLAALTVLSDSAWRGVVSRGSIPPGYAMIDGVPIAYGDTARRHTVARPPAGAARYTENYLGLGVPALAASVLPDDFNPVDLRVTFPPGDVAYIPDLRAALFAAGGVFMVETHKGKRRLELNDFSVIDEPLAGLACCVLTQKGYERKANGIAGTETLLLDVGGYTLDSVPIERDGRPDLTAARSLKGVGANNALELFEDAVRSNNRARFRGVDRIDTLRLHDAIQTGVFKFGQQKLDVVQEAKEALSILANEAAGLIDYMGGPANYDNVLLTGGGALLIADMLTQAYPSMGFVRANDGNPAISLQLANVYGAANSWAMLRRMNSSE